MTDPKQFICSFLGIPETGFAEVVINSKLMCDLLEAYVAHLEKQKSDPTPKPIKYESGYGLKPYPDNRIFNTQKNITGWGATITTNDTQEEYVNNLMPPNPETYKHTGTATLSIGNEFTVKISEEYVSDAKPFELTNVRTLVWDWKNNCYEPETKYPNLLNATNRD